MFVCCRFRARTVVQENTYYLLQGGKCTFEFNSNDFQDPYPEEIIQAELAARANKPDNLPFPKGQLFAPLLDTKSGEEQEESAAK